MSSGTYPCPCCGIVRAARNAVALCRDCARKRCRARTVRPAMSPDDIDDTQRPVDYDDDELDPFTDENGLVWVPGQWPTRGPM